MNLIELFFKQNIFINYTSEILYGDDQAYNTYPVRFPTVTLQLLDTDGLTEIADRIRKEQGFAPMHAMDEYTDDTCDNSGWYEFSVGLNGFSESRVDSCIEFSVVNSDSPDNETVYTIDLSEEEQKAMYARLDEECWKHLGQSCAELLEEARQRMEEDE